jgi:hypothetical protein
MKLSTEAFSLELSPLRLVDDEDWVRVQVSAVADVFSGDFEAYLQLEDLRRFKREAEHMYANIGEPREALLTCHEPGIYVRLLSEQLGGIAGTYRLRREHPDIPRAELSGTFRADQSHLPELTASIEELIAELSEQNDA